MNTHLTTGQKALIEAELDQESHALADVRDALMRLGAGEYGVCAECGAEFAMDRLHALPTAIRCVECETRHEHLARGQRRGKVHRAH